MGLAVGFQTLSLSFTSGYPTIQSFLTLSRWMGINKFKAGYHQHGTVVSEIEECSLAGVEVLREGGSAADAIIASSLCVGVMAPYHCGIGGGGFMLVRFNTNKGHDYEMVDFRESAPGASNTTMYTNSSNPITSSIIGGLSVAIPGEIRGWEYLHNKHGKLPWKRLFEYAIKVARDGFKVHARMGLKLSDSLKFFTEDDLWAEVYAPNGILVGEGDVIYQKRYANALEKLAEYGANYFYEGEMANNTIKAITNSGGIMTLQDLSNYTIVRRQPTNITYKNHRIFSTSTPSSGSSVLAAMKIYEGFSSISDSDSDSNSDLSLHRLIQANKFAYGQRTHFGDPAFTSNVSTLEHEFLSESNAVAARLKINDSTTYENDFYNTRNYLVVDDHGTCHLAAADSNGMTISLTTTINLVWGSQVMTDDGIILNDEMDDFSSPNSTNAFGYTASPANYIEPYKRPQSSIASTIVEDLSTGELQMVTGASGGSHIISTTLQYIYHRLEGGLSPEEIVRRPRWHDQLGNSTLLEWPNTSIGLMGFSNATASYLSFLNYNITYEDPLDASDGHIIIRDISGQLHSATDPRTLTGF